MFETPSEQPKSAASLSPIKYWGDYRPGKIPGQFLKNSNPSEDDKIGFSYYDKELKQRIKLHAFTGWFVGLYSQVAGAVQVGSSFYNFSTNLVADTRTDIMSLKDVAKGREMVRGTYAEVKQWLNANPDMAGVRYTKVVLLYVDELEAVIAFNVSQKLEQGLREAVAVASNTKPEKINLFNLGSLTSETWGFRFDGKYKAVDREGQPFAGKGEFSYVPELTSGVIKINGANAEKFAMLSDLTSMATLYVEGAQAHLQSSSVQRYEQGAAMQYAGNVEPQQPASVPFEQPQQQKSSPQMQQAKELLEQRGWNATADDLPF
jgi:hypothetical protein